MLQQELNIDCIIHIIQCMYTVTSDRYNKHRPIAYCSVIIVVPENFHTPTMEGFFSQTSHSRNFHSKLSKFLFLCCKAISSLDIYYFLLFITSGEKISTLPSVHFSEDKGVIHTVDLQISKWGVYFKFRRRRGAYSKGGGLYILCLITSPQNGGGGCAYSMGALNINFSR